ncbi:hypothetical protein GF337_13410 [candidate division KSB1 bacterium]|nr:hypothetical protein [candidate division KSB1 bacterium]
MTTCKIDLSRFQQKIDRFNVEVSQAIERILDDEILLLKQEVEKNLEKGIDSLAAGQPGKAGESSGLVQDLKAIKRSLKTGELSPQLRYLLSNPQVAPNNAMIHDGTQSMKPFRYMSDTVSIKRAEILQRMGEKLKTEMQRIDRDY